MRVRNSQHKKNMKATLRTKEKITNKKKNKSSTNLHVHT